MSKINNVFPVTSNIENMLLNIEQYFDDRQDIDSEVVLIKYGKKHKVELMFGYDVFTRKEDGTVCNSENDTKHYYIEVWNNFYDEEGYHLAGGTGYEVHPIAWIVIPEYKPRWYFELTSKWGDRLNGKRIVF